MIEVVMPPTALQPCLPREGLAPHHLLRSQLKAQDVGAPCSSITSGTSLSL